MLLSSFEGEWSSYLKCDGHTYWQLGEFELSDAEKMNYTLPSDSRLRWDVLLFKNGYEDMAQQAKIQLEEIQRNDKKLREKMKNKN